MLAKASTLVSSVAHSLAVTAAQAKDAGTPRRASRTSHKGCYYVGHDHHAVATLSPSSLLQSNNNPNLKPIDF